jgi:hypothetical protein
MSAVQGKNRCGTVFSAVLSLLAGTASAGDCSAWSEISVPSFGAVRDVVVDLEASGGPVHLLMGSKDNTIVNGDQHFHVLRRDGAGWVDLGEPDVSAIEAVSFGLEGVVWTAIAAAPDGTLWIGGEHEPLAQVNRGYQRPVFARWTPGVGWSEPVSVLLTPGSEYPHAPRGGSIIDMDIAPDGSVFASGLSGGWGGLSENNGSIPLMMRHHAGIWTELNVPDRDWPGVRGVTDASGVVAFSWDSALVAGRHPGGGGVGTGALIAAYSPAEGDLFVETPAWGGGPSRMVANDLDATGPENVWVVGEGGLLSETALLMHFDGSSWTVSPSPFAELTYLQHVAIAPDGTAWAFPFVPGTGPEAVAFFDGSAWSTAAFLQDAVGGPRSVNALAVDADARIWAGGSITDSSGQVRGFVAVRGSCTPCPADLTGDGNLNFFDLAAYLDLFNAGDPAADLAPPTGTINFFDLAAYLDTFNAGCP